MHLTELAIHWQFGALHSCDITHGLQLFLFIHELLNPFTLPLFVERYETLTLLLFSLFLCHIYQSLGLLSLYTGKVCAVVWTERHMNVVSRCTIVHNVFRFISLRLIELCQLTQSRNVHDGVIILHLFYDKGRVACWNLALRCAMLLIRA